MSSKNNVNPDHYKVAGRGKTGNAVAKTPEPDAVNRDVKARFDERQQRKKDEKARGK